MHFGTGNLARIDRFLQFKIRVGLKRSGGTNRGHASGKIQARKTKCHLAENSVSHGIKHVVVHADQAGHHAVALQVEHLSVFGHIGRGSVGHRLNLPFSDYDGLIVSSSSARTVDHAHVSKSNNRCVYLHEWLYFGRSRLSHETQSTCQQDEHDNRHFAHSSSLHVQLSRLTEHPQQSRILPEKTYGTREVGGPFQTQCRRNCALRTEKSSIAC